MKNNSITVIIRGSLEKFLDKSPKDSIIKINLGAKSIILDIVKELKIPKEYISLIAINGSLAYLDSKLNTGDRITLYPPISGG